jgi:hypothetical protein
MAQVQTSVLSKRKKLYIHYSYKEKLTALRMTTKSLITNVTMQESQNKRYTV